MRDPVCLYCSEHPVRMDFETFHALSYVPLLVLQGDKYAQFDQLYGTLPDEKDCPSLQKSVNAQTDSSRRELLVSTKVRKAISCGECTNPRCIYARSKLSRAEKVALENLKDSRLYTCGSSIFPPDSKNYHSIMVQENITCKDPVELQYFSATLVHYSQVCYWCGNVEEMLVLDEGGTHVKYCAHFRVAPALIARKRVQARSCAY